MNLLLGPPLKLLDILFGYRPRPRGPCPPLATRLIGARVLLRAGDAEDWRAWSHLRDLSRGFLTPWEPTWAPDALSWHWYIGNLRRQDREWREGSGYAFLIFLRDPAAPEAENARALRLVGAVTLNDVQRGIAQKATLGYWIGLPYAGQGLMTEAVQLVLDFAFQTLRLHRVEASCLPHNEPSARLLASIGFEREGHARGYLRINGRWEDHLLWGKCAPTSPLTPAA